MKETLIIIIAIMLSGCKSEPINQPETEAEVKQEMAEESQSISSIIEPEEAMYTNKQSYDMYLVIKTKCKISLEQAHCISSKELDNELASYLVAVPDFSEFKVFADDFSDWLGFEDFYEASSSHAYNISSVSLPYWKELE